MTRTGGGYQEHYYSFEQVQSREPCLLRLLEAEVFEAQRPSILCDGAHDIVRSAVRYRGVNLQAQLDLSTDDPGDVLDDGFRYLNNY